MKKLYFLSLALLSAAAIHAQDNLLENGGFETWTDGVPQNFEPYAGPPSINNFVTQETTIIHEGSSSLKHQSQSSTQYIEYDLLVEVTPGNEYTMSYWYLDNDDHAKTRIWSSWMQEVDGSYSTLDADASILRNSENTSYSVDSPDWVQKVVTVTAPADATHFRYQVRTYRESPDADGGYIYYDGMAFVNNSVASVKENKISDLKMFPNPLSGNILNITSNADAAKTVAIYDVLGKQVVNTVATNGTVNVSGLTSGVYIVKITEEGKTATRKLVVR